MSKTDGYNILREKSYILREKKLMDCMESLLDKLNDDYDIWPIWLDQDKEWMIRTGDSSEADKNTVDHPEHYPDDGIEIIDKVLNGIEGKDAFYLGNILKYVIRAGKKNDDDLEKANNYAHRLCTGKWRWEK